jgi:hypothetical protein
MLIYSEYKSTVDNAINRMDTNQFSLHSKTLCNVLILFPEIYKTHELEVPRDLVVLIFDIMSHTEFNRNPFYTLGNDTMRADVTSPLLCGLLYRKPMNVAVE